MTSKIFKSVLAVALAVLAVSVSIVFGFTYNSYNKLALEDVRRECEYIKAGIDEVGYDFLSELELDGVRITRIGSDGRLLFDSNSTVPADPSDNHLDREEIREALVSGEGSSVRHSDTPGKDTCIMLS